MLESSDTLLTKIFALIQPTILKARTKPIEAMGYDRFFEKTFSPHVDLALIPEAEVSVRFVQRVWRIVGEVVQAVEPGLVTQRRHE